VSRRSRERLRQPFDTGVTSAKVHAAFVSASASCTDAETCSPGSLSAKATKVVGPRADDLAPTAPAGGPSPVLAIRSTARMRVDGE
jgi:hypothetical protein